MHVVDISHPSFEEQIGVVNETLDDIGAQGKPTVMVFNKIDRLPDRAMPYRLTLRQLKCSCPPGAGSTWAACAIS